MPKLPNRSTFATALVLTTLSVAPLVGAQDTTPAEPAPDATYSFGDDVVEGDGVNPNLDQVRALRRVDRRSLIRARAHYLPQLAHSINEL